MTQLGFSFDDDALLDLPANAPASRGRRSPLKGHAVQLSLLETLSRESPAPVVTLPPKLRPVRAAPEPVRVETREPEPELEGEESRADAICLLKEQARVEHLLRIRIGAHVLVSLTRNTSTMISFRKKGRALYVRVHRMFGQAPDDVLHALASFISKDRTSKAEAKLLDGWIERHRPVLTEARAKAVQARPFGEVHDLQEMFARLNARYFGGKVEAQITWSKAAKKQRRTSIHMGTYSDELRLIRIHPALDQEFVPTFFVEFVVFHEMLHQVHDVKAKGCGRREVHTPAFREDEQRFERYREARDWERQNLKRLLRY